MDEEEILLEHDVQDGIDVLSFEIPMVKDGVAVLLLEDELNRILDPSRSAPPCVCIDFSSVDYIATTVLAKLISFYKKIKSLKGKLVLCGLKGPVIDVFKVTRFDKFFTIVEDRATAIKALKK